MNQRPRRPPNSRNPPARPLLLRRQPLQLPRHRALRQDQRRVLGARDPRLVHRFRRPLLTPFFTFPARCPISHAEHFTGGPGREVSIAAGREETFSIRFAAVYVYAVWRRGEGCFGEADRGAV